MASSGLIGNCCGNCTICEAVGFLNPGDGRRFTPSGFGITQNEGGAITLTLARNPPCFSYHGTPDDYAAAHSGMYPPIGNEDYFYNTQGSGSFWQKLGGSFYASGADPGWGVGEISISVSIERTVGPCPHMIEDSSQTVVWADGDVANKTVDIAITCPGPPQYWSQEGAGCGGEAGYAIFTLDDPNKYPCVQIGRPVLGEQAGNGIYLAGACTHDAVCACGDTLDGDCILARSWQGFDQNTVGWHGFTDGTTRFLKAYFYATDYHYDPFNPCTPLAAPTGTTGSKEMWGKAECVKEIIGDGFSIDIDSLDPSGIVDNEHYEFYDACGNLALTIVLSEEDGATPEPADAAANLASAVATSPDAGMSCFYECDPPDEPALAYAGISDTFPVDGIYAYRQVTDYTESLMRSVVLATGILARPYPYTVEMRTREFVYGGADGTFGSWTDISGADTAIEPPSTPGNGIYAEFRTTALGFHCHPGA